MSQTLQLDKRQRAMLHEMGVQVWQALVPEPAVSATRSPRLPSKEMDSANALAAPPVSAPASAYTQSATNSVAASASITSARGNFRSQPAAELAPVQPPAPPQADAHSDTSTVHWSVGQALTLYAPATSAPGPRWLLLAETPAAAGQLSTGGLDTSLDPFEGEAGKLLDNMLRAVRLHNTGSVLLAPLARRMGHEAESNSDFHAALASQVQTVQPDVVLVMGRLVAQAVLQSKEPFGKLRGHLHTLHGAPTVVTQDAAYLLRSPLEKAKAWEDLCLAVSVRMRAG